MDRRGFLRGLVGGVAITAAVPSWPFRVYSFAKTIIPVGLRVEDIEAAYRSSLFGYDEPDIIVMNRITATFICPKLADEIFKPSPIFNHFRRYGFEGTIPRPKVFPSP
jgi:hypothetical protein